MSDLIVSATDASFAATVIDSSGLILVDFWAEWCGPCKMIAPILEEVAKEYEGRVKVVKVDVDQNPNTPAQYNIRGIPTLILFKDGEIVETKVGALTKSQISAFLDEHCI